VLDAVEQIRCGRVDTSVLWGRRWPLWRPVGGPPLLTPGRARPRFVARQ